MEMTSSKGTPDQKIASKAKDWRLHDKVAIADKSNKTKQDAEWMARQVLRKTIDDAGGQP